MLSRRPGRPARRCPARPATAPVARGFTLIEVLVALVVLSFGLLGVVGLQAKSLQYTFGSYQRSQATLQAKDLVERLWAGACVIVDGAGVPQTAVIEAIRNDWRAVHQASLPAWQGEVTAVASAGVTRFDIAIRWTDQRIAYTAGDVSQQTQLFSYAARLPMLPGCP